MARTKGSLGKKTIEKLKAEGKWDYDNNCPCVNNINTEKNISELIQIEQESNSTPEKENNSTINSIEVESIKKEEIKEEVENIPIKNTPEDLPLTKEEPTILETLVKLDKLKKEINESQTKTVNKSNDKVNVKTNKYNSCDRCGAVIYCEPRRIDSNLLIGLADYHRHTPRYINLCSKCCHDLNDIFEDWLTNKEKGGNEDLKRYG